MIIFASRYVYFILGGGGKRKGKSKKWKQILKFPHISQCIDNKNKTCEYSSLMILLACLSAILVIFVMLSLTRNYNSQI